VTPSAAAGAAPAGAGGPHTPSCKENGGGHANRIRRPKTPGGSGNGGGPEAGARRQLLRSEKRLIRPGGSDWGGWTQGE
jgi:hypothetical protein